MICRNVTCQEKTFETEAELASHLLASDVCLKASIRPGIHGRCGNPKCKDIMFETDAEREKHILATDTCWYASCLSGAAEMERPADCLGCSESFPTEAALAEHFEQNMKCFGAYSRPSATDRVWENLGSDPSVICQLSI